MSLASLVPNPISDRANIAINFIKIACVVIGVYLLVSCINNTSFPSWLGFGPSKAELTQEVVSLERDVVIATEANKGLVSEVKLQKDLAQIDKDANKAVSTTEKAVDKHVEQVRETVRVKIKVIEAAPNLSEIEKDKAVEDEVLTSITDAFNRLPSSQKKDTP